MAGLDHLVSVTTCAGCGPSIGVRIRRTTDLGAGDAAQCDLWFPPKRIPLEDGTRVLLPVLVIVAARSRFITARMIPTRKIEDLLLGSWELIRQLGPGAAAPDLGQRARDRSAGSSGAQGGVVCRHVGDPGRAAAPLTIRSRRGSWSAATGSSRPRSCRAARSAHRRTSTPSWRAGWRRRTLGWCARSRPARSIWSSMTGRGCWRCRRSRCSWGGENRSGWAVSYYVRLDSSGLLRRPDSDRKDGRRDRRPGPGPGPPGRADRG